MGDTNGSCQFGWECEGNRYWTFYSVTLTDDYIQNHMLFKKKCLPFAVFLGLCKFCRLRAHYILI